MIQKKFAEIVGLNCFTIVVNVGIDLFKSFKKKVKKLEAEIRSLKSNDINGESIKDIRISFEYIYQENGLSYKPSSFNDMQDDDDNRDIIAKIDFELEILKAYLNGFRPHGSCIFPPKIVSFTMEEGQKLKKANVMWTLDSQAVEGDVNSMLEKGESFIFYRNGSFAGVNKDPKNACDIIFNEICWDHYLLVVGDDSGLKEELKEDIKIVAALAGLSDENLCKLYSKMDNGFSRFYGENAVFSLLLIPSKSILEEQLEECILKCSNFSLTIIYSGHGEQDFGWVLAGDDRFSGSDLKQVLSKVKPQHYPEIKILLNCCYGLLFAEKIINMQCFTACLKGKLDLPDDHDVNEYLEDATILPDETSKMDEWFTKNEKITQAICVIVHITHKFIKIDSLPYMVYIIPFAVGPLEAKGILSKEIVKNKYKELQLDWSQVRAPQKKLPSYSEVSDPQFFVFAAGNGDSTLFRWLDFNMLVDGGIYTDPPCFWRTVHQLPQSQKLDAVIVTHFDNDHIKGILRLFKEDPLPIEIGEIYLTAPNNPGTNNPGTRSAAEGNELWDLAEKHERKNLACDPSRPIITREQKIGRCKYRLRIFMLTPKSDKLEKAAKMMRACRRLTIPNQASASLLIECKIKKTFKYALLTGNAPSKDIIDGLNDLKNSDKEVQTHLHQDDCYCFDYIDMPHHGSKLNDPKYFLQKIKSTLCVISTNGLPIQRNHPHDETLVELNKAMTDNKIMGLLFTYCNQRQDGNRVISDRFSAENKEKLFFAEKNIPGNTDSKQCLLVKLATPVARRTWDIA